MEPNATKTSPLAIAALVCAVLFCVPLLPLVGLVLGIIALVKISNSGGLIKGQGLAIGAIVAGGIYVFTIPVLAAIAIPNYLRFQQRAKESEAKTNLYSLRTAAETYRVDNEKYPVGETGWVPEDPCGRERCAPNAGLWSSPPWTDLGFSLTDPHYYQYRYRSDGDTYTIEASADLDGDDEPGVFVIQSGDDFPRQVDPAKH